MRILKFYVAFAMFLAALYLFVLALRGDSAPVQVIGLKLGHGVAAFVSLLGMAFGVYLVVKTVKEELAVQCD